MGKSTAVCDVVGCGKRVHCKGLCPMHYQRLRLLGSLEKPPMWWEKPREYEPCSVDGCPSPARRKDMCVKCYQAAWHAENRARQYAEAKARREANRDAYLASGRAYYASNKDRILSRMSEKYRENPQPRREAAKNWARDNRVRYLEGKREYYQRHREQHRKRGAARYAANRDAVLEANRLWREANPERKREAARLWREANPARRREVEMRRRARKRGNAVTKADYAAILAEHGMVCHICTDAIPTMADLHFDHVIPLSKGGSHARENIKPAHAVCNLRKHNKLLA